MALGGGASCMKYLLFFFNLLFAITGIIILVVGAIALGNPYAAVSDGSYHHSGPIAFIIIGIIVFLVSFFGCCGAIRENHCMIVTFSVLMLLIFAVELGVGIAGYAGIEQVNLNDTIKEYATNKDVRNSFNVIQTDLSCCGVQGPGDWAANSLPIPESCCAAREIVDGVPAPCDLNSPALHQDGCLPKVLAALKHERYIIAGVGVAIAVVQLLGVVFACFLARSIRNQYETV